VVSKWNEIYLYRISPAICFDLAVQICFCLPFLKYACFWPLYLLRRSVTLLFSFIYLFLYNISYHIRKYKREITSTTYNILHFSRWPKRSSRRIHKNDKINPARANLVGQIYHFSNFVSIYSLYSFERGLQKYLQKIILFLYECFR
jgi:hypothetical protein